MTRLRLVYVKFRISFVTNKENREQRLERTSLWMRTINRDLWCDKNRFLTLSVVVRSRTVSRLLFFFFSFLAIGRRWVAFLALFHCVVFQTTKKISRDADQIPGKKRISGGMRPTCGWWNSMIAKPLKIGKRRRRRIVAGIICYGGTFCWCIQCMLLAIIRESQVFLVI